MAKNAQELLKIELGFIKEQAVKDFTITVLGNLPEYFTTCAASSAGKFHPSYAQGEGGLIRHTQAAVRAANQMLKMEMFNSLEPLSDYIYSALILHDGLKHGWENSKYVVANHPVLMSDYIKSKFPKFALVADLILSHMGQWNTDYRTKQPIMPKPKTKAQLLVHLADYLASRKMFEVNFEAVEI